MCWWSWGGSGCLGDWALACSCHSCLRPPATGLSGKQHPAPDWGEGNVCRRAILPLCLCKRGLFSQGGSDTKQGLPQQAGSLKTWLRESGQPDHGVLGQTLVRRVRLHIFPGPRISRSARQPQPRAPCKGQRATLTVSLMLPNKLEGAGDKPLLFFFL